MLLPRLVVLAGAERGKGLPLSDQVQFFVVEEIAGSGIRKAMLLPLANEQARLAEVRFDFDNGDLHVRNLKPFQTFSINEERSLQQGETATLRSGDVLTVHDVVLRVATGSNDGEDQGRSGLHVTVPDGKLEATIDKSQRPAEASDITKAVGGVDPKKVKGRLQCLQAIFREALGASEPKPLLGEVLALLGEQFPNVQGSAMWWLGKSDSFRRVARFGGTSSDVQMSRTVIKHVLSTQSAVLSHDTMVDARLKKSQSLRTKGTRSVLCVPIIRKDHVAGVIHLSHPGFNHFDPSDLAMVSTVAETCGSALSALEARQAKDAASHSLISGMDGMEVAAGSARVETGEKGMKLADVSISAGYVDQTEKGSGVSFAEVMPVPPAPGSLMPGVSPVLIGMGELGGQTTAVDAVRAHAVVRTLGPYGFAPGPLICEISRVLSAAGVGSEGNAITARYDPGASALHVATAGSAVVIHYRLMDQAAARVPIVAHAPSLGELTPELQGPPTSVPLSAGDTVVLIAGGLPDTGPQIIESICTWIKAGVGNGPPAIMKQLAAELGSVVADGRSASMVAIRHE